MEVTPLIADRVGGLMIPRNLQVRLRDYLATKESESVVKCLAKALANLHRYQVVHGNLKPTNILFDAANIPLLSDFGLGQLSSASSGMSRGNAIRSVLYSSPEQVMGGALTPKSDVYSLASLVWELVKGEGVFSADSPETLAQMHVSAPIPTVHPSLDSLFAQALAKSPMARPTSVTAWLNRLPDTLTIVEQPKPDPEKKKGWRNLFKF